jgi:iron-sulfur cluster assembly accessory protein
MTPAVTVESEPVVSLTPDAAQHVRGMLEEQPDNAGKHLRVYVEDGGCSGMQYGMVFDEKRENDFTVDNFGLLVLVDPVSAEYVRGAVVDYIDSLNGGGFKITNPRAKHSCGCGKSFEV